MYRSGKEEIEKVVKVIKSKQWFRVGDPKNGHLGQIDKFEKSWGKKIGTRCCLSTTSGTAALTCGLVGLGIGPGDEVLIPGYTFMATAIAVLSVGAIPVICEVDESLTIDPDDIERKASRRTKAIIPVHMVGFPCDMKRIMKIARKYNLKVLEDACQAVGGSYSGKRLGSVGDAGAFSFNHFKIISCGEGGALVTNEGTVYQKALVYHDGGAVFRPYRSRIKVPIFTGTNYRMNEILGAILNVQTKKLKGILRDLRKVKKTFIKELKQIGKVKFVKSNDIKGDCGTTLGFLFESEKKARKFATSHGVGGWLPIDSGKHIYTNWEPIMKKRGSFHPDLNPFNLPQNKGCRKSYTKNMCSKTLGILSRTVFISLNPDWKAKEIKERIKYCRDGVNLVT